MIELTIRTDNKEVLQKLLEFIATLDFKIVKKGEKEVSLTTETIEGDQPDTDLPVTWAEKPEKAKELFGIWKDRPKTIEEIRQLAWGDRL